LNQGVFAITANNVEISGLTIEGASDWSGDWPAGIFLDGVSGCIITKNTISNNVVNIILDQSNGNTITKNTISYSLDHSISSWSGKDNNIYLNNFKSNTYHPITGDVTWNSTSRMPYTYHENPYINYLGNYWDDYDGSDDDRAF
jgi:parallel beta-helix repeat protein